MLDSATVNEDDLIQPRGEVPWTNVAPGMWQFDGSQATVIVTIGSYVPRGPDLTPAQLEREARDQARGSRDLEITSVESGDYLGYAGSVRMEWTSTNPSDGGSIAHIKYLVKVGPRTYRVTGAAPASVWLQVGQEIEAFAAALDLDHPRLRPRSVAPGEARIEADGQTRIRAGASAREVQDAIATWVLPRADSKFDGFPTRVECDPPSASEALDWDCMVDLRLPTEQLDAVSIRVSASRDGNWKARVVGG